jgi:hypothetical protein
LQITTVSAPGIGSINVADFRAEDDVDDTNAFRRAVEEAHRRMEELAYVRGNGNSISWHSYNGISSNNGPDAMSMHFDLAPTELCYVLEHGIECGEDADPDGETGMCKKHRKAIRDKYKH